MKRILYLIICWLFSLNLQAQNLNCNEICVIDISLDSLTGEMLVTIYNGDTVHVNYPTIHVIDMNGDTVGYSEYFFFAHMPGDTVVHSISTIFTTIPPSFAATVLFTDPLWNITCTFSYPMNCFIGQSPPDCDDLTVESIQLDTISGTLDVTLFNNCTNCASGINGPVYCEMKIIRTVAPFDTLAESNCFCFLTPDNQSYNTYTLTSYVNSLPPVNDIKVIFHCGSGLCDTLQINPSLNVTENLVDVKVNIYPNPAISHIVIDFSLSEEWYIDNKLKLSVEIFDFMGRRLIAQSIREDHAVTVVLTENINGGFYQCLLKVAGRTILNRKLIILKG